jgi:tripartite-type tricarboxylate transporter receptor subunit TctC
VALAGLATPAAAQGDYPSHPIDFIVPFPPGGPLDAAIRILQPALTSALGQPIVLQNKGGAGGALGMDFVAKAKPDGYTVAASVKSTVTILAAMRSDLPYKPSDFIPVANAVTDLGVITAKAGGPWKSIDELIADAKKNPGKYSYGSAGVATVSHFMFELFKQSFGVDMAHVPFQGSGPVKNAILGGHVQLAGSGFSTMAPLIKTGDLMALVTTAPRRVAAFPSVPTMAEKGFPEASVNISVGLYVPARTPREIVAKLGAALEKALKDPAVLAAIDKTGMVIDFEDSAAMQKSIGAESEVITRMVNRLGLRK